jgi:hypothetical protein
MTNKINKTTNQIKLVKEKVNEAEQVINILEYYTDINNKSLTNEMLKVIIKYCNDKMISDF